MYWNISAPLCPITLCYSVKFRDRIIFFLKIVSSSGSLQFCKFWFFFFRNVKRDHWNKGKLENGLAFGYIIDSKSLVWSVACSIEIGILAVSWSVYWCELLAYGAHSIKWCFWGSRKRVPLYHNWVFVVRSSTNN